mgnify:CR=1 FL=1
MQAPRQGFTIMAKPAGPDCDMACSYCFYRAKRTLFARPHPRMRQDALERFITDYLELHPGPEVPFAWQGGEPLLMGLAFFEEVLRLQRLHTPPGKRPSNAVQTNGLRIDGAFARFFARNQFLLGVSLDGPASCHDVYRRRAGKPTHALVMEALRRLRDAGADFNILCAVHAANQDRPQEVYRFLRDQAGAAFLQFIPIVAGSGGTLCPVSVAPESFGTFLCGVWDIWRREDVGRVFVGHFDAALAAFLGQPGGLCAMAPRCGRALVLEHDGSLYPCDHFVDPAHRLGDILSHPLAELLDGPALAAFGQRKPDLPPDCRACPVLFACGAGCPKDRLAPDPLGGPPAPYLCPGFKRFFRHAGPELAAMAQAVRRQPAFQRMTV